MKRAGKAAKHILIIAAGLAVCFGPPLLVNYPRLAALAGGDGIDAVSSASLEIPDQPSGSFTVLMNRDRHPETAEAWERFFTEQPVDVIMEDLCCLVAEGDIPGEEMAQRCRKRLAENQMKLRRENASLLVSKAEQGLFDVVILSAEMEAYFDYSAAMASESVYTIKIVPTD